MLSIVIVNTLGMKVQTPMVQGCCSECPKTMGLDLIAIVIPIYKSKVKTDVNNYRPISLLPTLSKILEKVVHHRLYTFFTINDILYDNQYGFRPKHSTTDAVLKFTSHIMSVLEDNNTTMAVLLDLFKAFDTIDHGILLNKLAHYGGGGGVLWGVLKSQITNYFTLQIPNP